MAEKSPTVPGDRFAWSPSAQVNPNRSSLCIERALDESRPLVFVHGVRPRGPSYLDMHYALELCIVLDGHAERSVEGRRWTLNPGDVWTTGVWEVHGGRALGAGYEVLMVMTLPQLLSRLPRFGMDEMSCLSLFTAPPAFRPSVPSSRRREVLRIGKRLLALCHPKTWYGAWPDTLVEWAWARLHVMEILLILMESWPQAARESASAAGTRVSIEKALELVFSRRTPVTISEAASACDMGATTLRRHFLRLMGIGFGEFVLKHRIAGAAEQLRTTRDSIKKIAFDWNFTDSSHLDHLIRAHYGCSPTEYRKRKS